jgi:hypothetical protein
LQVRPHVTPLFQVGQRKKSTPRQRRIERRRRMALAEQKTVAFRPRWARRVNLEVMEVERGQDFRRRKRPARMARFAPSPAGNPHPIVEKPPADEVTIPSGGSALRTSVITRPIVTGVRFDFRSSRFCCHQFATWAAISWVYGAACQARSGFGNIG